MLRSEQQLRKKIPLEVRVLAILNLISGIGLLLNIIVNLLIGGSYTSIFSPMSSSLDSIIVDSLVVMPCLFVGFDSMVQGAGVGLSQWFYIVCLLTNDSLSYK